MQSSILPCFAPYWTPIKYQLSIIINRRNITYRKSPSHTCSTKLNKRLTWVFQNGWVLKIDFDFKLKKNQIFWVCGFQISCIVCTVAATHPIAFVTRCYGALKSVSWSRPVLFAKQRRYDSCRTIIAAGAAADPILHYLLIIYNIYYNNALLVNDFQYLLH